MTHSADDVAIRHNNIVITAAMKMSSALFGDIVICGIVIVRTTVTIHSQFMFHRYTGRIKTEHTCMHPIQMDHQRDEPPLLITVEWEPVCENGVPLMRSWVDQRSFRIITKIGSNIIDPYGMGKHAMCYLEVSWVMRQYYIRAMCSEVELPCEATCPKKALMMPCR